MYVIIILNFRFCLFQCLQHVSVFSLFSRDALAIFQEQNSIKKCALVFTHPSTTRPLRRILRCRLSLTNLHSFPGDTQGYCPAPCSSSARASICCRMLFRSQCTLGLDRWDSLRNTHSVFHEHYMPCRLRTMDSGH